MKVEIKCDTGNTLSLRELEDFQGYLKTLQPEMFRKLRGSIIANGFIAPFFIWVDGDTNYILDGHQRLKVLQRMAREGDEVPDLPVVYIHADNEKDAKAKLLTISSKYGKFDVEELTAWTKEVSLDFFASPEVQMEEHGQEKVEEAYVPADDSLQERIRSNIMNNSGKSIVICPYCGEEVEYEGNI